MERNAVGKRNELQSLLSCHIVAVRGRELLVDGSTAPRADFVQQRIRESRCKGEDVNIRPLDRSAVETIRPRPLYRLAGAAPRFLFCTNNAELVI